SLPILASPDGASRRAFRLNRLNYIGLSRIPKCLRGNVDRQIAQRGVWRKRGAKQLRPSRHMAHNGLLTTSAEARTLPTRDPKLLSDLLNDANWMTRGLLENTQGAYRSDMFTLAQRLEERCVDLMRSTRANVLEYISWRVQNGAKPRTTARQLSSFRRF